MLNRAMVKLLHNSHRWPIFYVDVKLMLSALYHIKKMANLGRIQTTTGRQTN